MATKHSLKAELRKRTGSGLLKQMRREGWLPSVIYGKDTESENLKVDARRFAELLRSSESENLLLNLEISGEENRLAFLQNIQYDVMTQHAIHADFLAVTERTVITAHVPVRLEGEPAGVAHGGILDQTIYEMEVRCPATKLPEILEFDVSALEEGDSLTIADIKLPEGVEALYHPEDVIASVVKPIVVEEPDEGAAEGVEGEATEAADAADAAGATEEGGE